MGRQLKVFVYITSVSLVLLSVFYFFDFYETPFKRDPPETSPAGEPLTIPVNQGRLGNQMFSFATLYGLATLNNRRIALMPKHFEILSQYFQMDYPLVNLSTFVPRDPWKICYWLTPADKSIPSTTNTLSGVSYPTSFTFFDHVKEDLRRIFRFKKPFREHAESVLSQTKRLRPWTKVIVGVHVRRGDYLKKSNGGWLRAYNGREVDIPYFQKAIQYFSSQYQNITFLAVSDDRKWTRENLSPLGILTLPEVESPGHDLAVLASCNHTIMSYGTFGLWASFLAGGQVVYFSDYVKPKGIYLKHYPYEIVYPQHWHGISTTPKGFWDNYTNPFM